MTDGAVPVAAVAEPGFTRPAGAPADELPMPEVSGVRHNYVMVNGTRLHIAIAGRGPELVLLHGWPQHWFSWRAVIAPLAEHYTVICPDIRGLGWSEGAGTDWRLAQLGCDLLGVMDHFGIERVWLVGHDWGAAAGYWLTLNYSERVARFMPLAGVHPWSWIGITPHLLLRPWHLYVNAIAAKSANLRFGVPAIALRTWRHAGEFTAAEIEIFTAATRLPRAVNATRRYYRNLVLREMPGFQRRARSLRLRVPTLHLNGAQDPLTRRMPESWQTFADDMQFELIENCGHFMAEEQPGELIERIHEFFGAPERGSGA